jgi:hypothetical protein
MPAEVRARIANALGPEVGETLGGHVRDAGQHSATDALEAGSADALTAVWNAAVEGRLPDTPESMRHAVAARGQTAPLSALQKLIDAIRRIESDPRGAPCADEWRAVRGAIHQVLAIRGSRVAMYDLRESLGQTGTRLPVSFLAALRAVGDRSCLEPLAARMTGAAREDEWWRQQLAEAFRTIAKREKITRRHAVMRRITARWPQAPGRVFPKAGPPSSS